MRFKKSIWPSLAYKSGSHRLAISVISAVFFTLFGAGLSPSYGQATDSERFFNSGPSEICGSTPRSCRHMACGIDPAQRIERVSCGNATADGQDACRAMSPTASIQTRLSERGLPTDLQAVEITTEGGRCVWSSHTDNMMAQGINPGPGYMCLDGGSADGNLCDGGLMIGPEFTVYSCNINFRVYAECPNANQCGVDHQTCHSVIFGLNREAMMQLSPNIENERLFRNLLSAVSSNFQIGILTPAEANAIAEQGIVAFDDVDQLRLLLNEERNRAETQ